MNGLIRGVMVPAGSREVRFTYDRSEFGEGVEIITGKIQSASDIARAGPAEQIIDGLTCS